MELVINIVLAGLNVHVKYNDFAAKENTNRNLEVGFN